MRWQETGHADRLMQCVGCGALATDIAARSLGWLQSVELSTEAICHTCQARSGRASSGRCPARAPARA